MRSRFRGVNGKFIIGCICDREVGQSGDTDGWRVSDGRCRSGICLRACSGFERRLMRDLRFEVSLGKSQGCGNGSRGEIFLIRVSWFWFSCFDYGRRRKACPVELP